MYTITANTIYLWIQEFAGGPTCDCRVGVSVGGGGGGAICGALSFLGGGVDNCNILFILSSTLYSTHKSKMTRL